MAALIYGAGNAGREVLAAWRARGVEPACFIDRRGSELGTVAGVPVLAKADAAARYAASDPDVVVAVHSPSAPVAPILEELRAAGFRRARAIHSFCREHGWLLQLPYWLDPAFPWDEHRDEIAEAREHLVDDESRAIFDEQLGLRRDGDYAALRAPVGDQYTPPGLPRWKTPVRIIDCGAYDGDTLRHLEERDYPVADVVAFEPDERNFARLDAWLRSFGRGRAVCAGVFDRSGVLSFSGEGTSARVDAGGTSSIRVETIDEACAGFEPNLIKMDVEGAEAAALDGAKATIARSRPGLAISIYHRPEDLWAIQTRIHALGLGYEFRIRSHAYNGFETVLYAVAP